MSFLGAMSAESTRSISLARAPRSDRKIYTRSCFCGFIEIAAAMTQTFRSRPGFIRLRTASSSTTTVAPSEAARWFSRRITFAQRGLDVKELLADREEVDSLLRALNSGERYVLVSAKVEGVGYPDLAADLGKSVDAVKKMASRATRRLRGTFAPSSAVATQTR